MAYEAIATVEAAGDGAFRRDERIVVLAGGAALGLFGGLFIALALGRVGLWPLVVATPLLAVALYLSVATFRDAIERRALGCSIAAGLVTASLFAWPISVVLSGPFWFGPVAAIGSMVLLASCWSGASDAVYRLSGQAAIVGAGAAYIGVVNLLG